MKKVFLLFFMICASALAQTNIDRLEKQLQNVAADTNLVNLLNETAEKILRSDQHQSFRYAVMADSLSEMLDYPKGKGESLFNTGNYYLNISDYITALEYYKKALKILDDKKAHQKLIADIFNRTGILYYQQGNYPKALEYYKKSLKINEFMQDENRMAISYNNIGLIYFQQDDYDKALEYYNKIFKNKEEISGESMNAYYHLNTGNVYAKRNDYSSALPYFQQALKLYLASEDTYGISLSYSNIGRILKNQGNFSEALEYLMKALNISSEIGSKTLQAGQYAELGDIYLKQQNIKEAYHFSHKAYVLAAESGNVETIQKSSEMLSENYAAMGLFKEAYEYHQIFKTMSDSLKNEENTRKIISLEYEYKFAHEREQAAQEIRDAVLNERIKRQALARNVILASSLIILIACLVLLHQHKLLKASLKEKIVLLKEIHHRVKNNLQIISSLFSLQSLSIDNQEIQRVLQDSRNRIHSIAKIHESLYQSSNLSRIDFFEYIQDLSNNLLGVYQNSGHINLVFDGERTKMTIEKAVPCGLILNELLTNALKHAFKKGQKGEIKIAISKNKDGRLVLTVEDNGRGMPEGFDLEKTETLGLQMVKVLTEQLEGKIAFHSDHGVRAAVSFA